MNEDFSHLYEDGYLSMEAKVWFLDVIEGHVRLLPEQHPQFFHMLELRMHQTFYEDVFEEYLMEHQRLYPKFLAMASHVSRSA